MIAANVVPPARAKDAPLKAESAIRREQARDLEALIRSFSDHERLGPLLNRILDALVLWTGVERGLLLRRTPDGRLVPRAARNLARADLTEEQMSRSQTLAKRALEAGEPVIAVDAASCANCRKVMAGRPSRGRVSSAILAATLSLAVV